MCHFKSPLKKGIYLKKTLSSQSSTVGSWENNEKQAQAVNSMTQKTRIQAPCSVMASTKVLPINSAEAQAAPPQTTKASLPHVSLPRATVQDPVHALQNTPHPDQPPHIPGISTGKVKASNRDRFFPAGTCTQTAPLPLFS